MTNIVSWEYYNSLYSKVTEDEFATAEPIAENRIRNVIGLIRWDLITTETFGYNVLQDTVCRVIDIMHDNANSGVGKGITSVSNDGYSESYSITSEEQLEVELDASIRRMLSGTGLVGAY